MENLSIMSTVFSMRFIITQTLIFQPTPRISRKKLNSANWFVSRDEALDVLTYRIRIVVGQTSLAFIHLWAFGQGIQKGAIIYNRIKLRDGHYVVIINCTILILRSLLSPLSSLSLSLSPFWSSTNPDKCEAVRLVFVYKSSTTLGPRWNATLPRRECDLTGERWDNQ